MAEPQSLPAPQALGAAQKRGLWNEAPAWRNLTLGAAGLTVAGLVLSLHSTGEAPAPPSKPPQPSPAPSITQNAPSSAGPVATPAPLSAAPQTQSLGPPTLQTPPGPPAAALRKQEAPAAPAAARIASIPPFPQTLPQPAPLAEPQAEALPKGVCLLAMRPAPNRFGGGMVVSMEDRATSMARIQRVQASTGGAIDPDYLANQRVTVRMHGGDEVVFVVPKTITVHLGDEVTTHNSARNPNLPCSYIPPLITADLGRPPQGEAEPAAAPTPQAQSPAPQAAAEPSSPQACRLKLPSGPYQTAVATVELIIPRAIASAARPHFEAVLGGKLDPSLLDNLNAQVKMGNGHVDYAIIPKTMTVHPGDQVAIHNGYRNTSLACSYVPITISADLGPAPSLSASTSGATP